MRKMNFNGKGWFYDSWRHSLAAKGISSSLRFNFAKLPVLPEDEGDEIPEEEIEDKPESVLETGMKIYKALDDDGVISESAPVRYSGKMLDDKLQNLRYDFTILWTMNRKSMGPDFERKYVDVKNKFDALKYDMSEEDRYYFEDQLAKIHRSRSLQYKKMDPKMMQSIYDSFNPDEPKKVELIDLQKLFGSTVTMKMRDPETHLRTGTRSHFTERLGEITESEKIAEVKAAEAAMKKQKLEKAEVRLLEKKERQSKEKEFEAKSAEAKKELNAILGLSKEESGGEEK